MKLPQFLQLKAMFFFTPRMKGYRCAVAVATSIFLTTDNALVSFGASDVTLLILRFQRKNVTQVTRVFVLLHNRAERYVCVFDVYLNLAVGIQLFLSEAVRIDVCSRHKRETTLYNFSKLLSPHATLIQTFTLYSPQKDTRQSGSNSVCTYLKMKKIYIISNTRQQL